MKKEFAQIAKNPLSQNIAKLLKYKQGDMESDLRNKARIISEKIKNEFPGKTLNFETIVAWALADKDDPFKARMFIGYEKLFLFAKAMDVNFWDLFIPDRLIDPDKLSLSKRELIKSIIRIDDKYIDDILEDFKNVTRARIKEEAERMLKLHHDLFRSDDHNSDNK